MCNMVQPKDKLYVSVKDQRSPAQKEVKGFIAGSRFAGSPLMFTFDTVEHAYTARLTLSELQRTQLCSRDVARRTLRREFGADSVGLGGTSVGTDTVTGYVQVHGVTEGRNTWSEGDDRSKFDLRVQRCAEAVA